MPAPAPPVEAPADRDDAAASAAAPRAPTRQEKLEAAANGEVALYVARVVYSGDNLEIYARC